MTTHETRKVAQIAVEAIVNDPTAYDADTIALVRKVGTELGVARLYMDMLPPHTHNARGEGCPFGMLDCTPAYLCRNCCDEVIRESQRGVHL